METKIRALVRLANDTKYEAERLCKKYGFDLDEIRGIKKEDFTDSWEADKEQKRKRTVSSFDAFKSRFYMSMRDNLTFYEDSIRITIIDACYGDYNICVDGQWVDDINGLDAAYLYAYNGYLARIKQKGAV